MNHQSPITNHQRITKPQMTGWVLEFGASLVLGDWCLVIPQWSTCEKVDVAQADKLMGESK